MSTAASVGARDTAGNVVPETRTDSHCDVLWDGTKLYIASHEFSESTPETEPIWFSRYSYDSVNRTYSLDPGFPVAIGDGLSNEALTIDKDSTGMIWAAWTQRPTLASPGKRVYVTRTVLGTNDMAWSAPMVLPTNTNLLDDDDICALIAFSDNSTGAPAPKIGVLWSDQSNPSMGLWTYRFSFHRDVDSDVLWSAAEIVSQSRVGDADDHINLAADSSTGSLFVAGKSAADDILLLRRVHGVWSSHLAWTGNQCFTRPIVLLNLQTQMVHVFATTVDPQLEGVVAEKSELINSIIDFEEGELGNVRMLDLTFTAPDVINNPTSTKQNVTNTTGMLVLAAHERTTSYWHADM